ENTYLDMYIYQVGKKMRKQVAGVEKYDESMKLMMEAYRDAAKEKNRKQRSYDNDENYSADKLQEAYRTGNLDLLDSINRLNSFSDAFDEKFLYSRNLLQANSIDSILKARSALFVGVGAAHLPGTRGVIEMLRRMGYKLRPIIMGERDSNEKDKVEKLRVPVSFSTQTSDDGFFKVDIPGKFYRFGEEGVLDQLQYADMANGSYYMVTRIKTNSQFWGHSEEVVRKKIDSLLYENVPGKILNRQEILRNGYKGLDIVNRTRRGDVQRYNIFVTPFEVIIFKMSGNGDYVQNGDESKKFFGSIRLKEYKTEMTASWHPYQPVSGGFVVDLPHEPFVTKNNSSLGGQSLWEYEADDKASGTNYTILRTDIHNYGFAEEDTFDLALLDESFSGSAFIDKQLNRQMITWKGYPALDCKYLHKDGSVLMVRFIIQGPHYYTLVAHGQKENDAVQNFFNSFEIRPFVYRTLFEKKDTSLRYSVKTTFYPEDKKIKLALPGDDNSPGNTDDDDDDDNLANGNFKNNIIKNDTTGETIYLSFYRTSRYYYNDDSSDVDENRVTRTGSWITRSRKKTMQPNGWRVVESQLSDTNSSRLVWTKTFYRNGIGFFMVTESDTLTTASSFLKNFFETFAPSDDLKGVNPFEKKSAVFFKDLFSNDSQAHKQAVKAIDQVEVDSVDFTNLKKAISTVNWKEKKYLEVKKSLINKLGDIKTRESSDFLKDLYYAAGDTIDVQYVALESLLQQQTQYAFAVFKTIISEEPPVIEGGYNSSYNNFNPGSYRYRSKYEGNTNYDNGDFWDELYDSVQLTRTILPEILPLLNLDDYKWKTMRLLARMIDSNLVKSQDYEIYFSKFYIEARQEVKKQSISEKRKLIKKAANKNLKDDEDDDDDKSDDYGNDKLGLYAKLLLPFWDKNVSVPDLFQQVMKSGDKKLRYAIMILLIKNNKPVADSTLNYFAAMDDYRYILYRDLKKMDRLKVFPARYDNKTDLAKSKLMDSKTYGRPDSVVFLDKLPAKFKTEQGYVYFFKYKQRKDDPVWKIATAGLISKNPKQLEIDDTIFSRKNVISKNGFLPPNDSYDFTSFTDTKLIVDQPLSDQLDKELKIMLYSRRKSAKEFYNAGRSGLEEILRFRN
ncbi:MAG TPA: TraB/GumN family protein, partial [Chitinophagaceae bacterium]|nr:TraB/GumN family protein [Chitinophagaceae bacterium]